MFQSEGRKPMGVLCVMLILGWLMVGCASSDSRDHYQIEGFYVFAMPDIHLGATAAEVRAVQGEPKQIRRQEFRSPNRVPLDRLPAFDEQWFYPDHMANEWIFFRDGVVVAAFREESDF